MSLFLPRVICVFYYLSRVGQARSLYCDCLPFVGQASCLDRDEFIHTHGDHSQIFIHLLISVK